MEDPRSVFQVLKPVCIKLSQSALSLASGRSKPAEITSAQNELYSLLTSISQSKPHALNHQLADYIFFPLSHVLRQYSKLPVQALENCLGCVLILLKTAWSVRLEPKLGTQLIILLTVLADTDATSSGASVKKSEELQCVIQECFAGAFHALAQTREGREATLATPNLPQLGKAVYEMLNALKNGPSAQVQFAALIAVQQFVSAVDDDVALGTSFLPGLVSSLQNVLLPTTASPRTAKLLAGSLQLLSDLLTKLLGDSKTEDVLASEGDGSRDSQAQRAQLDTSWLRATAGQIKTVLATVVRLRSHPRQEVQVALNKLCSRLISQCRKSLSDSVPFLLETMVTLHSTEESSITVAELQLLLNMDDSLADLLRTSLYGWLVSLPRVMQSKDDAKKTRTVKQIAMSFRTLSDCGFDISLINSVMADQLRDSVANSMRVSSPDKVEESSPMDATQCSQLTTHLSSSNTSFEPILATGPSSVTAVNDLNALLRTIASSSSGASVAQQLVSSIDRMEGDSQIACFWSSLELIRIALHDSANSSDLLAIRSTSEEQLEDMLEELYSISLEQIDPSVFEQHRDWRLQALSLETIALYAQQHKQGFRSELVESLYPIVHLMGSDRAPLRHHAIKCLNLVAATCGYSDAKELVISNVDYLVNAVALKLNTFDISAQAPQVLLMMVKLTGPRLLPYLDDLVESIFAALDAYHGYSKLVETLFTVLLAVAQEGAKTEQLVITGPSDGSARIASKRCAIDNVASVLRESKQRRETGSERHSERKMLSSPSNNQSPDRYEDHENVVPPVPASSDHEGDVSKPPVPKTYTILLKISDLTRHYLTMSSPSLRSSLLALLQATFPALSAHENSFLPLINTLWPTIVSRLEDEETYVVANALDTIACLCTHAGDFMRSRINTLWPELSKLARKRADLGGSGRRGPDRSQKALDLPQIKPIELPLASRGDEAIASTRLHAYLDAPTRSLQKAVLNVFKAIIDHVELDADIFDEMLRLIDYHILDRDDVRQALQRFNADAVWLQTQRLVSSLSSTLSAVQPDDLEVAPWAFVAVA